MNFVEAEQFDTMIFFLFFLTFKVTFGCVTDFSPKQIFVQIQRFVKVTSDHVEALAVERSYDGHG